MSSIYGQPLVVSGPEAVSELGARLGLASRRSSEYRSYDGLIRIVSRIERTDPLRWLAHQDARKMLYWRDRTGALEIAGMETAVSYSSLADVPSTLFSAAAGSPLLRVYGAMRFDAYGRSDEWTKFPASQFVVPKIELVQTECDAYLVCTLHDPSPTDIEDLRSQLQDILWDIDDTDLVPGTHAAIRMPGVEGWTTWVECALDAIRSGELDKVVLAQPAIIPFKRSVNPFRLLNRLRANNHDTYLFGFQVGSGECFIGASPESLYRRDGQQLVTESVAGTRRRGQVEIEDDTLGSQLIHSTKDRHEQAFVSQYLTEALEPLIVGELECTAPGLLKLSRVQHLRSTLSAKLCRDVRDADLLAALHPTPAVGGYPRGAAIDLIRRIENFDRGWYAGAIGWSHPEAAEFAVGIRSALVAGNLVYAYAGAGIVAGSQADSEQDEIEHKLSLFTSLFNSP